MDVDPANVDAKHFETLLRKARDPEIVGIPQRVDELLERALALWGGPALDGVPYAGPILRGEVARLEEKRLGAFLQLVDIRLATGRHTDLIGDLRAWIHRNPLNEELWDRLIRILRQDGRQGEAVKAYRRLRQILADELAVEPNLSISALYNDILSGSRG